MTCDPESEKDILKEAVMETLRVVTGGKTRGKTKGINPRAD